MITKEFNTHIVRAVREIRPETIDSTPGKRIIHPEGEELIHSLNHYIMRLW